MSTHQVVIANTLVSDHCHLFETLDLLKKKVYAFPRDRRQQPSLGGMEQRNSTVSRFNLIKKTKKGSISTNFIIQFPFFFFFALPLKAVLVESAFSTFF